MMDAEPGGMELQELDLLADVPAPSVSDIHRDLTLAQLRVLADQRKDRKIGDVLLGDPECLDDLSTDDHAIGAALIRDARQRLRDESDGRLAPLIPTIIEHLRLPPRIVNQPPLFAYVEALAEWHQDGVWTPQRDVAWSALAQLLAFDLSQVPSIRDRLLGFCAEAGLDQDLPESIESAVLIHADRPYLFSDPREFLGVMAYQAHHAVRSGATACLSRAWLLDWCSYLARPRFARPYRDRHRRLLRELRDEVHRRIWRYFRPATSLFGERGGIALALIALLIRIDHRLFVATGWSRWQVNRAWFAPLRLALRWLGSRAPHPARSVLPAPTANPPGLDVITASELRGGPAEALVTRAQGGLGDVLMMRAGLLELARLRSPARVYFATNRDLFAVFSREDPITLVDIERTAIMRGSFGQWVNLTECPAPKVEMREIPRVTTNRIAIFAHEIGVQVPAFPSTRRVWAPVDRKAELRAVALLEGFGSNKKPVIGIQLRAAETYRDAPILLEVARALVPRYNVVVFDNRPIARRPDDVFLAISDEPLPVILSLLTRLGALITPDSFALHFAGAHGIPCVGLFGPTDGLVRTRDYPTVRFVDARVELPCIPCWRHASTKCSVTDSFDSLCMRSISSTTVIAALQDVLAIPVR